MKFIETQLNGAYIIEPEKITDERGFFARTWCQREFREHGLTPLLVQCNMSFNAKKGTLRGMHYQASPYEEAKVVSCIRGAIYDVIIDLRPDSPTYRQWISVELNSLSSAHSSQFTNNQKMLYIPEGFAHGFLTLTDDAEVFYQMSEFYMPEFARGIRWNDPAFHISWPIDVTVISAKDQRFPDFQS